MNNFIPHDDMCDEFIITTTPPPRKKVVTPSVPVQLLVGVSLFVSAAFMWIISLMLA